MSKLIHQIDDYQIRVTTSGGKAGKGFNKTASVQVVHGDLLVKQIRFKLQEESSFKTAFHKARAFVQCNREAKTRPRL